MENKRFYIAGVQHHDLAKIVDKLSVGDELELVAEPTNKFDPNAVRIEYDDTMCGYVPKKFSAEIAAALSREAIVICTITKLNPAAKPWEMCEVELEVEEVDIEDEDEDKDDDY